MTSKAELLGQIEQAQATWEELAAAAQRSDMHRPGAIGEGSFVDATVHLNGWRTRTVDRLEAAAKKYRPAATALASIHAPGKRRDGRC